jgi:hypothetical protein
MTISLKNYRLSQSKTPLSSVLLQPGEYTIWPAYSHWNKPEMAFQKFYHLTINGFDGTYGKFENSDIVYTTDTDGNPKNRSVFLCTKSIPELSTQ